MKWLMLLLFLSACSAPDAAVGCYGWGAWKAAGETFLCD
jgi:hypothetical protein